MGGSKSTWRASRSVCYNNMKYKKAITQLNSLFANTGMNIEQSLNQNLKPYMDEEFPFQGERMGLFGYRNCL